MRWQGIELAGRYRLDEPLGHGGMGEVWSAVDLRLRRRVAVKILPEAVAVSEAQITRFRREAEITAALSHPGITTVFDIDEHGTGGQSLRFMVMELLTGRDLHKIMAEHPQGLPAAQVVGLAHQVLDALAAAHAQGVIHRDLKPANLFVLNDGRLKICDFGIARLIGATRITTAGAIMGTPLYMAPEQFRGGAVDERTDLYALGCVLYELLTGSPWLDTSGGPWSIMYQHLDRSPDPARLRRPDTPGPLQGLVLDLLAKHPDGRPGDVATARARMAAEPRILPLDQAVSGQPAGEVPAASVAPASTYDTPLPGLLPAKPSGARTSPLRTPSEPSARIRPFGTQIGPALTGHTDSILSAAFGRRDDQPIAITAGYDGTARVWDLAACRQLGSPIPAPWPGSSVAIGRLNGRPAAVVASKKTLGVYDLTTQQRLGEPLTGHTDNIWAVAHCRIKGRPMAVTASEDKTVRVWDLTTFREVGNPLTGNRAGVIALAIGDLNGQPIAVTTSSDTAVRVWDLTTYEQLGQPFFTRTGWGNHSCVAVGELNRRPVAVTAADRTVRVWDLVDHEEIGAPLTGHSGSVGALALGELDGVPVAVTGSTDKTVRVWDLANRRQLGGPLTGHTQQVSAVAFGEIDGRPIAISGSLDKTVRIWSLSRP